MITATINIYHLDIDAMQEAADRLGVTYRVFENLSNNISTPVQFRCEPRELFYLGILTNQIYSPEKQKN